LCSLILMMRGWRTRADGPWISALPWTKSPGRVLNFSLAVGGLVVYAWASERLGFILSGMLLLYPLYLALRVRPWRALVLAFGVTLVIHTLFYKLLRVPLPWGPLERFAW
jgi:putative tricarboxylic transport membrane protein